MNPKKSLKSLRLHLSQNPSLSLNYAAVQQNVHHWFDINPVCDEQEQLPSTLCQDRTWSEPQGNLEAESSPQLCSPPPQRGWESRKPLLSFCQQAFCHKPIFQRPGGTLIKGVNMPWFWMCRRLRDIAWIFNQLAHCGANSCLIFQASLHVQPSTLKETSTNTCETRTSPSSRHISHPFKWGQY